MGFVKVKVKIGNPEKPNVSREIELIADTGTIYTVIPKKVLEELKIQKRGKRKFKLANGKIKKENKKALDANNHSRRNKANEMNSSHYNELKTYPKLAINYILRSFPYRLQ